MSNKPLPEIIYVRRRVAALLALLVIIVLVVGLMMSLGRKKAEEPQPTGTASAFDKTSSPSPTSTEDKSSSSISPSPQATATESASASPTPEPQAKDSCALEDLIVEARANQPTYDADQRPTFYLTVKNPTKADCKVDLRKDGLKFEVYDLATNQRIWGDTDCNPSEDTSERVFPAGEERHYEAVWSRTSSAPNQCGNRQLVPAGSYFLHTLVGNNNSEAFTFNLK